ncbi:PH domain-containing protein [Gordonia sp. NPDC003422]
MTQPEPWRRLSPGTMVVQPVEQLPQLIPALIALVFAGQSAPVFSLLATVVVVLLVTVLPWLTTRYQVTPEHVQVRKGLLTRKVVTARRDRIRSVDLTAGPVHRILGLKKVIIGTGGDKDSATVKLNALSAADADALHGYLMTTAPRGDVPAVDVDHQPATVLTRFRPEWLRYSPFSMAGLATAGAALGLGAQIANDAGLFERSVGTAERAADAVRGIPVAVVIIIVVVGVIGLGSALSVLGYVLRFWNFTLTRHPDGTLRTERGLLTTNAVSFDESRIRGTHLHEPVLMRPVHGARLGGIAIGHIKHPLLLPPAPKDEAVRVGNLVADDGVELTMPLVEHGRTARTRRLNRAAMAGAAALILSGIPAVTGGPVWFLALGVIALAASMTFGVARYRHLGHAITDQSVVIAPPKIARHRNALDRDGIVGWATRASWFQRRADVRTVILATAAGSEGYELVDLDDADSDRVIATTAPPWMRQFLATARMD